MISNEMRHNETLSLNCERSANGFLAKPPKTAFDRMLSDIARIDKTIARMNTLISLENLNTLTTQPKPYTGPERRKQYAN